MFAHSKNKSGKFDQYQEFCDSLAPSTSSATSHQDTDEQKTSPRHLKNYAEFYSKTRTFIDTASTISSKPIQQPHEIFESSFIVSEMNHAHSSPKQFLIEHMKKLKEANFGILFVEHLFFDDQQLYDDYMQTGKMDPNLKNHLENLNAGFSRWLNSESKESKDQFNKFNFLTLVEAAYLAGIKVVGLDINCVYADTDPGSASRIYFMNYTALHIIQRETAKMPGVNWVALMGHGHINSRYRVKGMATLTGTRVLRIVDLNTADKLPDRKATIEIDETVSGQININTYPGLSLCDTFSNHEAPMFASRIR